MMQDKGGNHISYSNPFITMTRGESNLDDNDTHLRVLQPLSDDVCVA